LGAELADVEVAAVEGTRVGWRWPETLAKRRVTTTGLVTDEPLSGDGKGAEAVRDRQAAA
jgi:hypothetical protein